MPEHQKLLLVLEHRGLGTAVRALPICHAIRSRWPEIHLAVGCFRETERVLLEMCPDVSEVVRLSNLKVKHLRHWWRMLRDFLPVLRALAGYDAVVLLQTGNKHWPISIVGRLAAARVFDLRRFRDLTAASPELYYREITRRLLGLDDTAEVLTHWPALRVPAYAQQWADDFFRRNGLVGTKSVFLNPYRNSKQTGWGIQRYIRVARALSERGVIVMMHEKGGPDETLGVAGILDRAEVQRRHGELNEAGLVVVGEVSMGHLVALIDRCDLVLGDPSGPSWVAAAFGKPTVTIVSPTTESFTPFLPTVHEQPRTATAKHTMIIDDGVAPVPESAVAMITLESLAKGSVGRSDHDSPIALRDETILALHWRDERSLKLFQPFAFSTHTESYISGVEKAKASNPAQN
jgi:ADP-heptose:LPS heptosyltransferase